MIMLKFGRIDAAKTPAIAATILGGSVDAFYAHVSDAVLELIKNPATR